MSFRVSTWAIRNPIPISILFLALMIAGVGSYQAVPIKHFPEVSFPVVVVTVSQAGAAPSEMESQVTRLIEDAAAGISGVKHMTSTVGLGSSQTQIEFELGTDPQKSMDDVRAAVDRVRVNLPGGIDPPNVSRFDFDDQPILYYAVSSTGMSATDLSWFIDNTVAKAVQGVKGVGQVARSGGLDREINVLLDPDRLSAFGVTAPQVNAALRQFTDDASGGRAVIGGRELTVRVLGSAATVQQLRDLEIPISNGEFVRLGTVAEVGDGSGEQRGFARLNNAPVASFTITKTKGASEVQTEDLIAKTMAQLAKDHPEVTFTKVLSTVDETRNSYVGTVHVLLEGMLLAALVVLLFLRDWRATLIAAIAMPLSLVPTFAAMLIMGFSLNVVTLLSLTLVIGILVDDAIVEVENIQKRIERGARPYVAAIEGADAIGLAVIATTLTIVVVFTPVSMMNSMVGQFFREFGLTVAVAVLFSLLVARLVTPLLAAYFLSPSKAPHPPKPLPSFYQKSLNWALDHRWLASLLGGLFFIGSLVLAATLPKGFQPTGDPGFIYLAVQGQPGATRDDMENASRTATNILLSHRADVDFVFTQIGATGSGGDLTSGRIVAVLKANRVHDTQQMKQIIRPELRRVSDARITTQGDQGGTADVEVILASENGAALARSQARLLREMRGVSEITEPRPAPPPASAELIIRPKPAEAARLGVSSDAIAQIARVATLGDIDANVAKFSEGERRLPIRVRLPESARTDLNVLGQLQVPTKSGKTTPLESVADLSFEPGPAKIVRYDRERRASVEADLNNATIGQALSAIHKLPVMKQLPAGVHEAVNNDQENMKDLFSGIIIAMMAGIALIYAVLVVLFKSFFKPLTILSALPLSLGGAFIALSLVRLPIDLPVMIGMLMLLGVAAKNSILLVEFALEAERAGQTRMQALQSACRERSRPVVMTTVAMSAGMMPTALAIGQGSEWSQPMAVAVIGGLISSTALSLILVPVVYEFVDDFEQWVKPRLARLITPKEPPLQAVPEDRL